MNLLELPLEAVRIVRKSPDAATQPRPRVVLYSSAESWTAASATLVHIARGLEESGIPVVLAALDGTVGREFIWTGLDTTVVESGIGEARRLRRTLRTLGAKVVLVDGPRDLRIARRAATGLGMDVIGTVNDSSDTRTTAELQRGHVDLVRRLLRPLRIA